MLKSNVCNLAQLQSETFRQWAVRIHEPTTHIHRKIWEWCYIAQALHERGMLAPGKRGLGFAVGQEPLVALFASHGCEVVATDLDAGAAEQAGWVQTNQHAASLTALNQRGICPEAEFARRVSFRVVNMNDIPPDLRGFDFVWSSCSIEHVGSIELSLKFMERMTECLVAGGVAVHTTELNLSSRVNTFTTGHDIIYRRSDLAEMRRRLRKLGHAMEPFDYRLGKTPYDRFVDRPPYVLDPHLKLTIGPYVSTSIGLIVTAHGAASATGWRALLPAWLAGARPRQKAAV